MTDIAQFAHYILEGTQVVFAPDRQAWSQWMQVHEPCRVAYTKLTDEAAISTVFLGFGISYHGELPPLFETMVFWPDSAHDGQRTRARTWQEAAQHHQQMVETVRQHLPQVRTLTATLTGTSVTSTPSIREDGGSC